MCIGMANGGKTPKEITPQEVVAVEELKIMLPYHKGSPTEKIYKLAINALEKQIPKKPIEDVSKDYWEYKLSDHLIENGVIVPPCKVGSAIYIPFEDDSIQELEVYLTTINEYGLFVNAKCKESYEFCECACKDGKICRNQFTYKDIGKTIFLTKEEAEQELRKEGEGNEKDNSIYQRYY